MPSDNDRQRYQDLLPADVAALCATGAGFYPSAWFSSCCLTVAAGAMSGVDTAPCPLPLLSEETLRWDDPVKWGFSSYLSRAPGFGSLRCSRASVASDGERHGHVRPCRSQKATGRQGGRGTGGPSKSCSQAGGKSPFALAMKSVMCRFLSGPGGWGKECGLGEV